MRASSVRRMVSRACFAAAAIAVVAPFVASVASAQTTKPSNRPRVFTTATSATGVAYQPDQEGGLTPIPDTFRGQFVSGKSSMSSSNGPAAKAFVIDPGNGATQGPPNACPAVADIFPIPPAGQPVIDACVNAKWPFMAQADGFNHDKRTEGALAFGSTSGQMSGEGGSARAVINDEDGTSSTDSTMSGLRIAALPAGTTGGLPLDPDLAKAISDANGGSLDTTLFSVGSIQATTQNLFEGPAEVSHAESRLNGVRFIGGLMTIDSITSISDVHFTVNGDAVGTSSTTVQGARVLGRPVTIDDKGVHGENGDDTVAQQLQAAGLSIRLVGAKNGADEKGFMTASSEGVIVEYSREVQTGVQLPPPPPGNPLLPTSPQLNGTYFVHYNLATVSSRAFARNLTVGGSGTTGSFGGTTSSLTPPSGSAAPSGFTGGTSSAPAASLAPATGDDGTGATSNTAFLNLDFDLRWLYLAFTLVGLGMCIAPRMVVPARLPGLPKT